MSKFKTFVSKSCFILGISMLVLGVLMIVVNAIMTFPIKTITLSPQHTQQLFNCSPEEFISPVDAILWPKEDEWGFYHRARLNGENLILKISVSEYITLNRTNNEVLGLNALKEAEESGVYYTPDSHEVTLVMEESAVEDQLLDQLSCARDILYAALMKQTLETDRTEDIRVSYRIFYKEQEIFNSNKLQEPFCPLNHPVWSYVLSKELCQACYGCSPEEYCQDEYDYYAEQYEKSYLDSYKHLLSQVDEEGNLLCRTDPLSWKKAYEYQDQIFLEATEQGIKVNESYSEIKVCYELSDLFSPTNIGVLLPLTETDKYQFSQEVRLACLFRQLMQGKTIEEINLTEIHFKNDIVFETKEWDFSK